VCPAKAIKMVDKKAGEVFISETRFGPLTHAQLGVAEETSGLLVSLVRNTARMVAKKYDKDLIVIDGPPGIGCPVIASITGVDLVLIVTEPTLSGIHDLKRILDVSEHFKIPSVVCINKYDLNDENCREIERYCNDRGVKIIGKIPYDGIFTKAMVEGKNVIEYNHDSKISRIIDEMWCEIKNMLKV